MAKFMQFLIKEQEQIHDLFVEGVYREIHNKGS